MTMLHYSDRIADAKHDYDLDTIIEQAAWDDDLTHEEYCSLYQQSLDKYWSLVG